MNAEFDGFTVTHKPSPPKFCEVTGPDGNTRVVPGVDGRFDAVFTDSGPHLLRFTDTPISALTPEKESN